MLMKNAFKMYTQQKHYLFISFIHPLQRKGLMLANLMMLI